MKVTRTEGFSPAFSWMSLVAKAWSKVGLEGIPILNSLEIIGDVKAFPVVTAPTVAPLKSFNLLM